LALNKANKDAEKVLLDRGVISQQEYNAEIAAINHKQTLQIAAESEAQRKLAVDNANRIKKAVLEIDKSDIDLRIKQEESVTKNNEKELQDRLDAYAASLSDKAALLKKQYDYDITQAGLNVDELAAIDEKYRNDKIALTLNSEKRGL
jgi:hypothetical protein